MHHDADHLPGQISRTLGTGRMLQRIEVSQVRHYPLLQLSLPAMPDKNHWQLVADSRELRLTAGRANDSP